MTLSCNKNKKIIALTIKVFILSKKRSSDSINQKNVCGVTMRMQMLLFLFCAIIYCSPAAYPQEPNAPLKESTETSDEAVPAPEETEKPSPFPFIFIEAGGGRGLTYPSGQIAGNNVTRKYQNGYEGGFTIGVAFYPFLGLSFECEYLKETVRVGRTFANLPTITTCDMEYINYLFGYYGTWKILYVELGYFQGIASFDWKKTTKCNGIQTTETIKGDEKRDINGYYYGIGVTYNLSDAFHLKLGFRGEQATTPALVSKDRISPTLYMVRAGFEYHISL